MSISVLVFIIFHYGSSQVTFENTFGGSNDDWAISGNLTTDGGYINTGATSSFGAGDQDIYLIKIDMNGNLIWHKTFGGILGDQGKSVMQTNDGGYIICGWTKSFGAGNSDVYLVKTNSNGDTLWTNTFGGTDEEVGQHIIQLSDGSYVLTGNNIVGTGNKDIFLIKASQSGANLWFKTYGGANYDLGLSCSQTTDGGFIVVGMTDSYGAGNLDVFLLKTNANGDSTWSKTYGGSGDDFGEDVKQTTDGGYILTSVTQSFGAGGYDVFLIKTNANGDTTWTKTFGGAGDDFGNCVIQTNDGGYAIIGSTQTTISSDWNVNLIKTNSSGILMWSKTFGGTGTDYAHSIHQTSDGGYFITGTSYRNSSLDAYLIKTDANGNLTSISENDQRNTIDFYPNPTNNSIKIQLEKSDQQLEIFNAHGQLVYREEIFISTDEISKEIDLSNLPKTLYLIKVISKSGVKVGKVVKD